MDGYEDIMDYLEIYLYMENIPFHRIVCRYYKSFLHKYKTIPKTNYIRHANIMINTWKTLRLIKPEEEENNNRIEEAKEKRLNEDKWVKEHTKPQYENISNRVISKEKQSLKEFFRDYQANNPMNLI